MLPNVVYAGMGKSGSTLLHKLFLRHPDIYVSPHHKEINFFSRHRNWSRGLEWYEGLFSGYAGERWVVDISPGYHNKSEAIERMRQVLGERVKILFTFRRFTDFAYSRYLHRIRGKMLRGSFLELLEQKAMFYKPLDTLVDNYIQAFGRNNVFIMHYEKEFDRSSPSFERALYGFLGLPQDESYYQSADDGDVNSGYCPRFVHAGDRPYEEEFDGVPYRVPNNTLVFCSGRSYRNIHWTVETGEMVTKALELQRTWTTSLEEEEFWYVQKKYTEPLADRLQDKLGLSFAHWYVNKPRRIAYRPAPLPDAYITDPDLLALRRESNKSRTPWS